MSQKKSDPANRATTQTELPPGIDAPSPQSVLDGIARGPIPHDVEQEVRRLAERVGGMARLRELVTTLAADNR
jgi:hypothetical protein